jgi:hypothetical protein
LLSINNNNLAECNVDQTHGPCVPQAPGSWVRPAESCVVSQYNCAPPVKPQKKTQGPCAKLQARAACC